LAVGAGWDILELCEGWGICVFPKPMGISFGCSLAVGPLNILYFTN
ncbi:7657_t:CDS:1, partial [Funneliformis geosporum]